MTRFAHQSVLFEETLELLAPRSGGRYCDCTLGGGGHTEGLLERSAPDGVVVGLDRDPSALEAARGRLAAHGDRLRLVHAPFSEVATRIAELGVGPLDGILADLGVSSPQLDVAARGFSFRGEGPLDMRMDPTRGETARELCARLTEDELAAVIRNYGEERFAGRVARAIKKDLDEDKLHTTTELAAMLGRVIPQARGSRAHGRIDPATRTFQALRIAVNDELDELDTFLSTAPALLAPGGRIVVIAFHSLEDRMVKHAFRADARVRPVTKRPVEAGPVELERNPRSRSAKLRAAERVQ